MEASGFGWAVTMAKEKDGDKYLFEGDAQGIHMLQGTSIANSSLAVIIRDTINIGSSYCDFISHCFL